MCEKTKGLHNRIDKCIKPLIRWLKNSYGYDVVACCCGHSKYPMTIVVKYINNCNPCFMELLSKTILNRKRKFYKKDKQGYYFIPEIIKEKDV